MNQISERLAVIEGVRTPFAKAGGELKDLAAQDLGQVAFSEALSRSGIAAKEIDEVIVGCVGQPAEAMNIARVIALYCGLDQQVPAVTVHRNCASGMESITSGWEKIRAGQARIVLAGGAESMSNLPLLYGREMTALFADLSRSKSLLQTLKVLSRFRLRFLKPIIGVQLGLTDPVSGMIMGDTAEVLAREFHISRQDQDAYALESHQKACAAAPRLKEEIVPVPLPPKYTQVLTKDMGPRDNQSMEALQKLKPFFDRHNGTVTVGNACPITDGAAAVVLMSESQARDMGLAPLGYVRAYAYAGLDPARMGLGPVYATHKMLRSTGFRLKDFDLVEVNEAFAAQVLACEKAFGSESFSKEHLGLLGSLGSLDMRKVNVNGGAIALGHPVGTTGTRLVLTLLKELGRRGLQHGLATLCVGGGQGAALHLEKI